MMLMIERIKIACTKESLKDVRAFVTSTLNRFRLPETEVNLLVLAVDEICANRIIHSNHCDGNKELEVEISDSADGISFSITDSGDFYDASKQADPDMKLLIKERRKGGIGLLLVRKIMDSIEVKRKDSLTTHTLYKKLKLSHA